MELGRQDLHRSWLLLKHALAVGSWKQKVERVHPLPWSVSWGAALHLAVWDVQAGFAWSQPLKEDEEGVPPAELMNEWVNECTKDFIQNFKTVVLVGLTGMHKTGRSWETRLVLHVPSALWAGMHIITIKVIFIFIIVFIMIILKEWMNECTTEWRNGCNMNV